MKSIPKHELKAILDRQLTLIDENLELRNELEFRDYRIQRLEQEIANMQKLLQNEVKQKNVQQNNTVHRTVNIYV